MDDWISKLGYSWSLHRTVLNFYWLNMILLFVADLAGFTIDNGFLSAAAASNVFRNIGLQFAILLILEFNYRYFRLGINYITTVPAQVTAALLVIFHPQDNLIPLAYFLPLIISILTLKTKNIVLNIGISLISYIMIYQFVPSAKHTVELSIRFTALVTILAFGVVLVYFNKMLNRLFQQIEKKTEENQRLLVKTKDMDRLNKIDALTNCYNHKSFHEHLGALIQQAERHPIPLHLALLDIDDFKLINDHFGHWSGDQVLKRIAAIIKNNVTGEDKVFRYGGEEFAILFQGKNESKARKAVENICQQIAEIRHHDLNGRQVTISIGLKTYKPAEGKEAFFKATDAALYEAKRLNKNRIVVSS